MEPADSQPEAVPEEVAARRGKRRGVLAMAVVVAALAGAAIFLAFDRGDQQAAVVEPVDDPDPDSPVAPEPTATVAPVDTALDVPELHVEPAIDLIHLDTVDIWVTGATGGNVGLCAADPSIELSICTYVGEVNSSPAPLRISRTIMGYAGIPTLDCAEVQCELTVSVPDTTSRPSIPVDFDGSAARPEVDLVPEGPYDDGQVVQISVDLAALGTGLMGTEILASLGGQVDIHLCTATLDSCRILARISDAESPIVVEVPLPRWVPPVDRWEGGTEWIDCATASCVVMTTPTGLLDTPVIFDGSIPAPPVPAATVELNATGDGILVTIEGIYAAIDGVNASVCADGADDGDCARGARLGSGVIEISLDSVEQAQRCLTGDNCEVRVSAGSLPLYGDFSMLTEGTTG